MQRILHVVNIMDRGGVETLLMNIYRQIDRNTMQFDFLTHPYHRDAIQEYENEIKAMGGIVYKAPRFVKNPIQYRRYVCQVLDSHRYQIVHGHSLETSSVVYMREVKKRKLYLIAHAHNTGETGSVARRCAVGMAHRAIRQYPDFFFGCSDEAINIDFGFRNAQSDRSKLFHNGIDLSRYNIDEYEHQLQKADIYGTADSAFPVFGTVGRLTEQKNQLFLLDVFAEIMKREPISILSIVGKGGLENALRSKASDLGIASHVRFEGSVPNVPSYLKAFDVFLFPSIYEGLGMAGVEAQAAGLPTLMSTNVPSLAHCTDLAQSLPLSAGPNVWADKAIEMYRANVGQRKDRTDSVREAGFDISQIAQGLCDFYEAHGGIR